jgi:hypothetical protein
MPTEVPRESFPSSFRPLDLLSALVAVPAFVVRRSLDLAARAGRWVRSLREPGPQGSKR